jgi:hypothetical protein
MQVTVPGDIQALEEALTAAADDARALVAGMQPYSPPRGVLLRSVTTSVAMAASAVLVLRRG